MTCGQCAYYLTDKDESGNVTEFHHCTGDCGFCALEDLFTYVEAKDDTCEDFILDKTE